MRRYKYRAARLFHIVLWSIIFILSFYILIKCIRIFYLDSLSQSTQTLEANVVSAACNNMIQSNLPILDYIENQKEKDSKNLILSTMAGVFPINRYIVEAKEEAQDNLIEDENKSLLYANNNNLLLNKIKEDQNTYNTVDESSSTDDKGSLTTVNNDLLGIMPIDIISGEVYLEHENPSDTSENTDNNEAVETLGSINGENFTLNQLLNRQFLYNNFYIIDSATVAKDELFDAEVMLGKDMTIELNEDKPQILIYHTHSQEAFIDSREGKEEDTIVGVGTYLAELLSEKYDFNVIHDTSQYDMMEGYLERNLAYNYSGAGIKKILEDNPTIEIVIDLHRDGGAKRVTSVDGKDTAQVMLFNGLSRNSRGEENTTLKNPYLQDNLAFSLQVQLKSREMYPGFMYKNYLKAYRYNMNLCKKSLLIETGTAENTLEEAMNAMELLSDILYEVVSGDS